MEINMRVRAKSEEMEKIFQYDDVLNIRYYNMVRNGIYDVIIRVPECDIKETKNIRTLDSIKEEVVKKCPDVFKICSKVYLKNGEERIVYASTDYWKEVHAKELAKVNDTEVKKIEEINRIA